MYDIKANELYHHGVKGQKWGVRHDKKSFSDQYTQKQYNRDKGVYGTIAAKRLQKKMRDPNQSVQGLRSKEAERIASFRKAAKVGGKIGLIGGAVGGYFGGRALSDKLGLKSYSMPSGSNTINKRLVLDLLSSSAVVPLASGAAGAFAGKKTTEMAIMAIGGYSPSKLKGETDDELEQLNRLRDIY